LSVSDGVGVGVGVGVDGGVEITFPAEKGME
jgi:hypothetical protein